MRFWDSSAIVPLILAEARSGAAMHLLSDRGGMTVWWGSTIECTSAIARAEREARLDPHRTADAVAALRLLRSGWTELDPTAKLRDTAERLIRVHPLRAADALQLAAAIIAAEDQPPALPFVTLDERLAEAADREGFPVVRFDRE